ncbi:MAG: YitT family protein [Clostridia bacterium]|nr:YitT family protein [Clostridia bacterium]
MKITKKFIRDCFLLVLLGILLSLSQEIFVMSNSFAPSGINGLATMIQYLFNFNVGYMSLIINIPLCTLTFFLCDKEFAVKTIIFVLAFSFSLLFLNNNYYLIEKFVYFDKNSAILAPIAAGVVSGFTGASAIKLNSCTGGTDVIAKLYHKKNPSSNFVYVIFALNVSVAAISYFVYNFKIEPVILCIIYCFVSAEINNKILSGAKKAIKFEIITSSPQELSKDIIENLHHSVTLLDATGMYTNKETNLLVCIINTQQVADFENLLKKYPNTFAYISSVNQTLGNFKRIKK